MNKKLFAFDVDGTLLNSQKELLDSTVSAIKQLKKSGHVVTVATGRSRFLIEDILEALELETYIICNGAVAFHEHQQIFENALDRQKLLELAGFLDEKAIDLALTGLDGICRTSSNDLPKMKEVLTVLGGVLPAQDQAYVEENEIYQGLGFYNEQFDSTFEEHFPDFRFVRWHKECVDVISSEGSKATTLLYLAEQLNIAQQDIIAFGDGNNDLEMLALAGVGVAMGNASEKVKSSANLVTDTNDDNGIYKALKRLGML